MLEHSHGKLTGVNTEKNLDLKIQSSVAAQLGVNVFDCDPSHFFDHRIGEEIDHLSSLLRKVVSRYLRIRLKTYGKKFTEEHAHGNKVST